MLVVTDNSYFSIKNQWYQAEFSLCLYANEANEFKQRIQCVIHISNLKPALGGKKYALYTGKYGILKRSDFKWNLDMSRDFNLNFYKISTVTGYSWFWEVWGHE